MDNMRIVLLFLFAATAVLEAAEPNTRPNILWITSEDNGPHLGAYGDLYADTPNLDRLAASGMIYTNAWSTAPVCAPARTTIISGLYPASTGSQHMRSLTRLPARMKMFPQYLREAGYYCTNHVKEDYNLEKPGQVWDESSRTAHWRNRPPGQPFFAVFNFTVTHESQIRRRPHEAIHDPAAVRVPAYHPDTPEVRRDWAQYYDKLTEMDTQVGALLEELASDGLTEDTIIFYYGDHGPGIPRSKRLPYNSGLAVPLIVRIPAKYRYLASGDYAAGGTSERLVGFIDLAPTVLSLTGIRPPAYMQGHAFLGPYATPPPVYAYGFRDRMDERYDLMRVVRDSRFLYIRNYMPHRIYGQYIAYMFQTPTTRIWKQLYDQGVLKPPQTCFWETKPPEEFYDLTADSDEIKNLAAMPEYRQTMERFRRANREFLLQIRDLGFLPENEIHSRSTGSTPYEMGHDPDLYPLEKILQVAEQASSLKSEMLPNLVKALGDEDSAVRYWAALGLLMRGSSAVNEAHTVLKRALTDTAPAVRIAAAEALGRYGTDADLRQVLAVLIELADPKQNHIFVSMMALNALDYLDDKARPLKDRIAQLPTQDPAAPAKFRNYAARLIEKILADLEVQ